MGFVILYVTHKNIDEAKKIGEHLLDKKMIACANYMPIESSYWWNGKIESDDEIVSLLKTRSENWKAVEQEIEAIHPYDVPCIIKIDVDANSKYSQWIYDETAVFGVDSEQINK